ncbi:MAG TPA: M2 family metallopeptidase [Fredinandcohnia sp.]|nr:M2 family metallopeptidase [Fredinandcohnia sp.]
MRKHIALFGSLLLVGCAASGANTTRTEPATPEEARAFVERVNEELRWLRTRQATAEWVKATYITEDTDRLAAWAREEVMAYMTRAVEESKRFDGLDLDPETARAIMLLKLSQALPAPSDPALRSELAMVASQLQSIYGRGKWCGPTGEGPCRDLGQLSETLATSRDWDELLDAWVGWRTVSPEMRVYYARNVELGNMGAREMGFADLGELWRSGYDMSPAELEAETERLWQQVKPLYDDLHCFVRSRLQQVYGEHRIPSDGPIPAHVLGNMWAQDWSYLYPLVEPFPGQGDLDVDQALVRKGYDAVKMTKLGEQFFLSLGFDPLPETFWTRSMLVQPRDRDVVCHASAWDLTGKGDIRIKMCIRPTEEDLITIHHELGHNFYYQQYNHLPLLFQRGAHDGFHEAVGDAIALSITPSYLQKVGLIDAPPADNRGLINFQMKMALQKIAFLPFGKLIDQWRWDVFAGKVGPEDYNKAWWELRERYQGVAAPVERTEEHFDPGAKYHIPANVPYLRYFLAHILQFQFHKAMCDLSGHEGLLAECSVFGSEKAGEKLRAMLAMGQSRPWPDALEALTGTRQMDAAPLIEYFAPLHAWLKEQNAGKTCGW